MNRMRDAGRQRAAAHERSMPQVRPVRPALPFPAAVVHDALFCHMILAKRELAGHRDLRAVALRVRLALEIDRRTPPSHGTDGASGSHPTMPAPADLGLLQPIPATQFRHAPPQDSGTRPRASGVAGAKAIADPPRRPPRDGDRDA
jgi:hypothetical protein